MARRKKPMRLRSSPWTHLSLYVVILAALINATALIGFLLSFVQQAAYSGNTSRWNIVIIVALIAGVLATSLFLIIARIFAVRSVLRSIPKPYIPVKTIDVPKEIASYIQTEYTRTALVAHLSQPNATKQEGWGHPSRFRCVPRDLEEADTAIAASPLAGVHFRSTMRSSFWVLLSELDSRLPLPAIHNPDYPADSIKHILAHPCLPRSPLARNWVRYYLELLDEVRYARSEPDEAAWIKLWGVVFKIFEFIRLEDGDTGRQRRTTPGNEINFRHLYDSARSKQVSVSPKSL